MNCELCGHDQWQPLYTRVPDYITGETFDVSRCVRCGLAATLPPPAEMLRYYPPRYRTERQRFTESLRVWLRAAAVGREFPKHFRGRLLDLGCGRGHFALEMRRRGWDVAVTEVDEQILATLRAAGLEAKHADDAMRTGFGRPFDAITCWHVLEHVPHPLELAKWARRHLTPNGIFQVTVPNLASCQAKMFGSAWLHLDVPRHLFHFTPATLRQLMAAAGFRIDRSATFAFEYDLFGFIQSALNKFCAHPNVLFERLTNGQAGGFSPRDLILSYAAAPFLTALAIPHCLVAAAVGCGATLTMTCRASESPSPRYAGERVGERGERLSQTNGV